MVLLVTLYAVHHKFFDPYLERAGAKLGCVNKQKKEEENHTVRQDTNSGIEVATKKHNPEIVDLPEKSQTTKHGEGSENFGD